MNEEELALVNELLASGKNLKEIADQMGIPYSTLTWRIKDAGWFVEVTRRLKPRIPVGMHAS